MNQGVTLQDLVGLALVVVAMVKIFVPIAGAIAERIRGRPAAVEDPALAAEVDHLRGRLAEVEERLDFAERLLSKSREADQLPGSAHR